MGRMAIQKVDIVVTESMTNEKKIKAPQEFLGAVDRS